MMFKSRKTRAKIPDGFTADDIRIESSICHGEKTIGFYNAGEKRLYNAELVKTEDDIKGFYRKYGVEYNGCV